LDIEAGPQQHGEITPQIASFFQFMQDSGSEMEEHVSEMDKVGHSAFHPSFGPKADVSYSAWMITPYRIRND